MNWLEILLILASGFVAGTVNAVVGTGSLLTFPTLLAVGLSPVVANMSNTVGLVLGNVSGVVGYRRELAGQRTRLIELAIPTSIGGVAGAILLIALPAGVFHDVVLVLILFALGLVIAQPRLSTLLAQYRDHAGSTWALRASILLAAIYGGYFGAGVGVIFIGILSVFIKDDLQRLNAVRNVLAAVSNAVAAVVFIFVGHVAWEAAGLLAVSSIVGGQLGATVGRRLPANVLRTLIVIGGAVAVVKLLVS
ncbi:MAG: sulfite exporter TauE/SafE family protein [Candidatus Dormibacteraeota bacterium]|nr:sulfite exporter TauE/SafE family protein [Candidatus Dormibacteraeota bacterium]